MALSKKIYTLKVNIYVKWNLPKLSHHSQGQIEGLGDRSGLLSQHFWIKLYFSYHFYTEKNAHYFCSKYPPKAFFKVYFQKFLGGGPPNPPCGRGSPPTTPTPVSPLRALKCPYRPLAPCPFQLLAGALLIYTIFMCLCVHSGNVFKIILTSDFFDKNVWIKEINTAIIIIITLAGRKMIFVSEIST